MTNAGSKLTELQQRYYDPAIGRFLSLDPVAADTSNGWNFNRYNYAANNPYKFTDPDGREVRCSSNTCSIESKTGTVVEGVVDALTIAVIYTDRWIQNAMAEGTGDSPAAPGELVGEQDAGSGGQGGRHNSGPLSGENGGTGDAGTDFGNLTGGVSGPAPEGSRLPPGSQVGENGVIYRPDTDSSGPRIDIPASGDKPHETLHYPKPPPPSEPSNGAR